MVKLCWRKAQWSGRRLHWLLQAVPDRVIFRLEEKQWLAFADHYILNFSNEDGVVARISSVLQTALKVRQRAMKDRRALRSTVKTRASSLGTFRISFRIRIMFGDGGLRF